MKFIPFLPAWFAGILLLFGCRKPTPVGIEILPPNQAFGTVFTDTFDLVTWVGREDSLVTSLQQTYILGSMSDPVFGNSYGGIFTQVRLPASQTPNGPLVFDSAVLVLNLKGPVYGEESSTHDIVVYRVTEDMVLGEDYLATRSFQYDPIEIGRMDDYLPNDTAELRIPLNQSFGEMLLAESQTTTFSSLSNFQSFLKGIYIAPDTSNGHSNSMMLVDLLSAKSTLSLHFRDDDNDTLVYSFIINSLCASQNLFIHNYEGTQAATALADSTADDLETLVEGINGLRLFVKLPDLSSLGEIAVNKAELVLTVIDDTIYTAAANVIPRVVNDSGRAELISDQVLSDITVLYDIGGALDPEVDGSITYQRYRINLASHMQLLARGDVDEDVIFIRVYPPTSTPARVRLGGTNHADHNVRMKLNLTYTKLM